MTEKENSSQSTALKIFIVLIFIGVIGFFINNLYTGDSDTTVVAFSEHAEKFERHVISSHYQWQVRQKPSMIMLIHYNESGKEVNRKPVRMNHCGWPNAQESDEGCAKVWTSLIGSPLRVDGFNVKARFYSTGTATNDGDFDSRSFWCRYSISKGVEFDYFPAIGEVTPPRL